MSALHDFPSLLFVFVSAPIPLRSVQPLRRVVSLLECLLLALDHGEVSDKFG